MVRDAQQAADVIIGIAFTHEGNDFDFSWRKSSGPPRGDRAVVDDAVMADWGVTSNRRMDSG